jgi:O-antigen/teichoic acid export membrane protein
MSLPLEAASTVGGSLKKRAAKSAIWISVEMVGVQGASFVVFAGMAHFISPRAFGLISICFLVIQFLQMLVLYNVATVAVRKQHTSDLDFTTTFWITLGISAIAFLLVMASAGLMERLFHASGLTSVLRAMAVIILTMGLSRTHETWMMRHFRFKSMAIRGVTGAVLGGAFGLLLAIKGYGVTALVGQQVATALISLILMWVVCPWRPGFQFSMETAREIFTFLYSIVPNALVYTINQSCDTFLVALFFGPVSAGFYNVGKRVRLALQLVAGGPIKGIALPSLAEMQSDPERLRRGALNSLTVLCVICAPIFFGVSAVSQWAVPVIFGPKWLPSIPIMEILSIGGLAIVLLNYNDNIFVLKNKTGWCLAVSASYSALTTVLVVTCAAMKIHALAFPFVLPFLFVLPFSAWLASKCVALSLADWTSALLPGIGAAILMFLTVKLSAPYLSDHGNIFDLIQFSIIGGVAYVVFMAVLFRNTAKMVAGALRHIRAK